MGLSNDEIPFFLNDLRAFFNQGTRHTLHDINLEMEELGWGIEVVDMSLFDDLIHYFG